MAERLRADEAAKLERRVAAAERKVLERKARYEQEMATRAVVFLECFESGLTIPEIAKAADRSPAMVSIALADARQARADHRPAAGE